MARRVPGIEKGAEEKGKGRERKRRGRRGERGEGRERRRKRDSYGCYVNFYSF